MSLSICLGTSCVALPKVASDLSTWGQESPEGWAITDKPATHVVTLRGASVLDQWETPQVDPAVWDSEASLPLTSRFTPCAPLLRRLVCADRSCQAVLIIVLYFCFIE